MRNAAGFLTVPKIMEESPRSMTMIMTGMANAVASLTLFAYADKIEIIQTIRRTAESMTANRAR